MFSLQNFLWNVKVSPTSSMKMTPWNAAWNVKSADISFYFGNHFENSKTKRLKFWKRFDLHFLKIDLLNILKTCRFLSEIQWRSMLSIYLVQSTIKSLAPCNARSYCWMWLPKWRLLTTRFYMNKKSIIVH